MKLITAIVRPEKLDELIATLIDNRAHGLTVTKVRGLGQSPAMDESPSRTWRRALPAGLRPDEGGSCGR